MYDCYEDALERAEEFGEKVRRYYEKFNVFFNIKEKDIEIRGDRFVYEIRIKAGTRVADIKKYAKDVQMKLRLPVFRIEEVEQSIFIILSEFNFRNNSLISILADPQYLEIVKKRQVAHPLGMDSMGNVIVRDLALYPHLLIAGTTGSGKSVALQSLLVNLTYVYSPAEINLLVCDRGGDLQRFCDFPHLVYPVIESCEEFFYAMQKLEEEMEYRISLKGDTKYSSLPRIICVIDEFTSFIAGVDSQSKETREIIMEILRRGRHAKIHMVLAAHNPTQQRLKLDMSDVPTKMVFRVARQSNSLAVLNQGGAEKLSGNGDMLFQSSQSGELQRIQGVYVSQKQLEKVVPQIRNMWKTKNYNVRYKFIIEKRRQTIIGLADGLPSKRMHDGKKAEDKLLAAIIIWALEHAEISCNMIIENFNKGWKKANNFIEKLYDWGIVGELNGKLRRKVLPRNMEDIPEEVLTFLKNNGGSKETLTEIFSRREADEEHSM